MLCFPGAHPFKSSIGSNAGVSVAPEVAKSCHIKKKELATHFEEIAYKAVGLLPAAMERATASQLAMVRPKWAKMPR